MTGHLIRRGSLDTATHTEGNDVTIQGEYGHLLEYYFILTNYVCIGPVFKQSHSEVSEGERPGTGLPVPNSLGTEAPVFRTLSHVSCHLAVDA